MPTTIVTIDQGAFSGCASLKSVTIPKGVTTLGGSAFSGCAALESIEFLSDISVLKQSLFSGCKELKSFTIPDTVKTIEGSVFSGCTALAGVKGGKNLESIGGSAFSGCSALTAFVIPESVSFIDDSAFNNTPAVFTVNCGSYGWEWAARKELSRDVRNHRGRGSVGQFCSVCGEIITAEAGMAPSSSSGTQDPDDPSSSGTTNTGDETIDENDPDASGDELIPIKGAAVSLPKTVPFTGAELRPAVTVVLDGETLVADVDYTAAYSNNIEIGTASVTITGKGNYEGIRTASFSIVRGVQPMRVTVRRASVRAKLTKKKAQTIAPASVFRIIGQEGKVTFKKKSGSAKLSIRKNGTVTVKKGTTKGTYQMKVTVTAAGNSYYAAGSVVVSVTVKVK
ncbi:MAG: hypothetical protein BZ136_08185 [Methanosphaera sp. rholeuAM74]|nr:MAG: hypothetical protein BZ136_08185 [Methanosphaera sp. rholeuAM74]